MVEDFAAGSKLALGDEKEEGAPLPSVPPPATRPGRGCAPPSFMAVVWFTRNPHGQRLFEKISPYTLHPPLALVSPPLSPLSLSAPRCHYAPSHPLSVKRAVSLFASGSGESARNHCRDA